MLLVLIQTKFNYIKRDMEQVREQQFKVQTLAIENSKAIDEIEKVVEHLEKVVKEKEQTQSQENQTSEP